VGPVYGKPGDYNHAGANRVRAQLNCEKPHHDDK
jgi:hypothetical protein